MTERIKIEVDDTDLDRFMLRLSFVLQQSSSAFGTTDVRAGTRRAMTDLETMALAMTTFSDEELRLISDPSRLPSLTREMRIILGQIPGMREYMRLFFDIKRAERGIQIGGGTLMLTIATTAILLAQRAIAAQKKQERELDFLRTVFGDYFNNAADLEEFTLANRLTNLEEWREIVIATLADLGDDQFIREGLDNSQETE